MTLADRVEQASGPDRELDATISVVLKLGCRPNLPDDLEYLSMPSKHDPGPGVTAGHYWFHCRSGMSLRSASHFTASLDAVASLLPEGYAISGGNLNENDRAWACVTACHGDYLDFLAQAATEPLARLAAILRAHEKGGVDND